MGSSSRPPDDVVMYNSGGNINHHQETSTAQSKSFREVILSSTQWFQEARKIVKTSFEWDDKEDVAPEDELAVKFDKLTLSKLRDPWKLTLMGKCMGVHVKSSYMESRVRAMWKIKGSLEIIDIGSQVFLFKFIQPDDYERALYGGPWFILDHYLMLSTWKPNFRPSINKFDSMFVMDTN